MDSKSPPKGRTGSTALSAALLMIVATSWSGTALARTQTESDCDRVARALNALDAPAETLGIRSVDHVPIQSESAALDEIDLDEEPTAPMLRLAPRVSNALRNVFDDGEVISVDDTTIEIAVSPVAEREDVKDSSDLITDDAGSDTEQDDDLPLLQRRMYRTDI